MLKNLGLAVSLGILLVSCSNETEHKESVVVKDTIVKKEEPKVDSTKIEEPTKICVNDSLNALANIMSGIIDTTDVLKFVKLSPAYRTFSKSFDKRWMAYDSTRLTLLRNFRTNEISKVVKKQSTLFYPFSGPDILYAQTFFPDADKYVMIGLEPVGSFPQFKEEEKDSLEKYFNKV